MLNFDVLTRQEFPGHQHLIPLDMNDEGWDALYSFREFDLHFARFRRSGETEWTAALFFPRAGVGGVSVDGSPTRWIACGSIDDLVHFHETGAGSPEWSLTATPSILHTESLRL